MCVRLQQSPLIQYGQLLTKWYNVMTKSMLFYKTVVYYSIQNKPEKPEI